MDSNEKEVNTVSGNVNARNINANHIEVNTVSGSFEILSSKGQVIEFNSVSGSADVEGRFDKWDINTVSGKQIITSFTPLNIKAQSMGGINYKDEKVDSPFVYKSDTPQTLTAKSVSGRIIIKL